MKVHTEDAIALFGVLMCLLFGTAGMGDWVWASVAVASIVFMRRRFAVFVVLTAIAPFAYTTVYGSFTLIGQLMAVISAFLCGASRVKHCRLGWLGIVSAARRRVRLASGDHPLEGLDDARGRIVRRQSDAGSMAGGPAQPRQGHEA